MLQQNQDLDNLNSDSTIESIKIVLSEKIAERVKYNFNNNVMSNGDHILTELQMQLSSIQMGVHVEKEKIAKLLERL